LTDPGPLSLDIEVFAGAGGATLAAVAPAIAAADPIEGWIVHAIEEIVKCACIERRWTIRPDLIRKPTGDYSLAFNHAIHNIFPGFIWMIASRCLREGFSSRTTIESQPLIDYSCINSTYLKKE
jgi:hypothetical protein